MRDLKVLTLLLLGLCAAHLCRSQTLSLGPSSQVFVPSQAVGSDASGTSVSLYGCLTDGATLRTFTLWANAEYIRGLSATLTNGSTVLYGCVNVTSNGNGGGDGCNSTGVRTSSFSFEASERVTNMTLWPGYDSQKQANQRAGAVFFSTSLGRVFDFGMTDARINPVVVNVGSGIPCGVNPRAGADIDALGFVFLRNVTSSILTNVQYEGFTQQPGMVDTGSSQNMVDGNSTTLILSNQTYNNSIQTTNLTAGFASETPTQILNFWSSNSGVDSYLTSAVDAAVPLYSSNLSADSSPRWGLSPASNHSRSESNSSSRSWNYTINVPPGGISRVVVSAIQSDVSISYTGLLNVTLDSSYILAIPVEGYYDGQNMSPISILTSQVKAGVQPPSPSPSSKSGGGNNTLAWVLGVVFGVLGGLLFAALLAWAIVVCMRRRQRRQETDNPAQQGKPPHNSFFFVPGLSKLGNDKQNARAGNDIEMGSTAKTGKKGWEPDPKVSTVMGVPVNSSRGREGDAGLPESEGGFVVSYNKFRRLRLDSIRQALGLAAEESPAQAVKPSQDGGSYTPPRNTPEGLSNPPSGASTPTSISNTLLQNPTKLDSSFTGDNSKAAPSDEDQKSETGGEAHKTPNQLPVRNVSPSRFSNSSSSRIKDRVAAIRAERRGNSPSPRTSPTPTPAAEPQLKPTTPMDKGKAMFFKLKDSVSSSVARRGNRNSIQHDNTSISLTGKPKVASQATPVDPSSMTPKPSTPTTPVPTASSPQASKPAAVTPLSSSPRALRSPKGSPRGPTPLNRTPQASTPRATTPNASKSRATTPKASTPQAAGPQTPPQTTSGHTDPTGDAPDSFAASLPKLKLKERSKGASGERGKPKNVIKFEDANIKLGDRYQTQGRNE